MKDSRSVVCRSELARSAKCSSSSSGSNSSSSNTSSSNRWVEREPRRGENRAATETNTMHKKKEMLRMLRRYILKRNSLLGRDSNEGEEEEGRLKVRIEWQWSNRCIFVRIVCRVFYTYLCLYCATHYWCGSLNFKGTQRKRGIPTFREDRRMASFVVRNDETDGIPIGKWTELTMGFFNVSRKYGNSRKNSKAMKRKENSAFAGSLESTRPRSSKSEPHTTFSQRANRSRLRADVMAARRKRAWGG
ncbi:hypothetical protein V1478_002562 [Vespula squamosa]|uniref:Uncharacterized protein n=1 Tax=Vespula squamosa TaxID=30214 RepID=A0ABD2BSX2_VESSQ